MAYETLTLGKSSSKSDVWSYGVLLWEIFTLCDVPYAELPGGREIVAFLDVGGRSVLPPPLNTTIPLLVSPPQSLSLSHRLFASLYLHCRYLHAQTRQARWVPRRHVPIDAEVLGGLA